MRRIRQESRDAEGFEEMVQEVTVVLGISFL